MNRYICGLLVAAAVVACAIADHHPGHAPHPFDDQDDDDDSPANIAPIRIRPTDDTVLSVTRPTIWTFAPGPRGPSTWAKYYPKCRQLNQAPINIARRKVIPSVLKPLKFYNFEQALHNVAIQNIWRFGNVDFNTILPKVTIQGGPLPGKAKYYLTGLYFTVGKNKTHGSMHSIDGRRAPFEISFVFHSNPNATLESHDKGSEVILHFLGRISRKGKDNLNYAPVIAGLKKVTKGGQETFTNIKSLRSLFPRKTWELNYYTYTGSSIIPPCTEGRIRIVYQRQIQLSAKQVKAIQGLYNEKNKYIWNNYRPQYPNTYVQVFSSIEAPRKPTTPKPKPNIAREDPYAPPVIRTTTRKANIVPTTTTEQYNF